MIRVLINDLLIVNMDDRDKKDENIKILSYDLVLQKLNYY